MICICSSEPIVNNTIVNINSALSLFRRFTLEKHGLQEVTLISTDVEVDADVDVLGLRFALDLEEEKHLMCSWVLPVEVGIYRLFSLSV